jgi:lipoprotein-anchoring transpeptidase ErfK/SrfK
MRTIARTAALTALVVLVGAPTLAEAAPTISSVVPAKVVAGTTATASGVVAPAAAGVQIRLQQRIGSAWTSVGAVATTNASGAWSIAFRPMQSGAVRALQLSDGSMSAEGSVTVAPKVLSHTLLRGTIYPFLGTRATWRIAPATYSGPARIQLTINKRDAGWVRAVARHGVVSAKLPTNGTGAFRASLQLPATATFAAVNDTGLTFSVRGARVGSGAPATWVRALRTALQFRGVYVPRSGGFGSQMGDSVIAFHKAYGRPRTTTFEASDWARLTARKIKPKFGGSGMHIEVDKRRQLLMQVTNGTVTMAVHVSSGRTGNTPNGTHKILWKGNWVPSLYGSKLYKSMAFIGAYAIHGYPNVPTTAASHGCVRVPMWIAATLYSRSPVGTTVYVYQSGGTTVTSVGKQRKPDLPELTGIDPVDFADETR